MLRRDEGQITVFLALVFLVMLGVSLCVLEGMYSFMTSSLAEDAVKGAGNYVLANYDRPLFDRYHLFFLDPRERFVMEEDGKEYLDGYVGQRSFFRFSPESLTVTEERTAVEEDGLYVKHQIREWMKYREIARAGESLKELFSTADETRKGSALARTDMDQAQGAIEKEKQESGSGADSTGSSGSQSGGASGADSAGGSGSQSGGGSGADSTGGSGSQSGSASGTSGSDGAAAGDIGGPPADTGNPDNPEETSAGESGLQWKEIKEMLDMITQSGILLYVTDDVGALSNQELSVEELPSESRSADRDAADFFSGALSFLDVSEWKELLSGLQVEKWDSSALVDEFYLLAYAEENFASYVRGPARESALQYETEYLIAGKASDRENLKAVANRILGLRFLANYVYLSGSSEWKAASGSAAAALTGLLGFPQAKKVVEVLLTAAVSFGESMLDVHALFAGEKVPIMKDASTWNLTLQNAAVLLKNKGPVKQGKRNAGYEDYLKLLLAARMKRELLLFRMMDLMQANVALEEPGFLMEECLFAFRWEAEISCAGWFRIFPGVGRGGSGGFTMEVERMNSY